MLHISSKIWFYLKYIKACMHHILINITYWNNYQDKETFD